MNSNEIGGGGNSIQAQRAMVMAEMDKIREAEEDAQRELAIIK